MTPGRDGFIALGIVAGVVLLQLPFRLCAVNLVDEGAILQIAADIGQGHRLYADAVHYAFPGIFYLTAAAFALAGTSVETARALAVLIFAVAAGVVYLIARWSWGRRGALGILALFLVYRVWAYPHWQVLSYSPLAVTLALTATWVVGEAFAREGLVLVAVGGVVSATSILAKQDMGLAVTAVLAVAVVVGRPGAGALAAFAAGVGLVAASAGAAIVAAGFGPDLVREAIVAPLFGARHFAYLGRPPLWPLVSQDPGLRGHLFSYLPSVLYDLYLPQITSSAVYRDTAAVDVALKLVYHLPWILLVVAGLVLLPALRRPTLRTRREVLLALLGVAALVAFNRPHDWVHLLVLYPPTLLLGSALLARLRGAPRLVRVVLWSVLCALLGVAVAVSSVLALELRERYATPVVSRRGMLQAAPAQARALQAAIDALATTPPPGGALVALPYHPLLNFLSVRPGLGRFYIVWPVEQQTSRDAEIVRQLEEDRDALVVYSPTQAPHFPPFADYAPGLMRHLVDHFAIDRTLGGEPGGFTFLLLRRASPPAGRSLLDDALARARCTIEPQDGPSRDVTAPTERQTLVGEALWPFRRVLRTTTLPDATVAVALSVAAENGARFEVGYGVNADRWGDLLPQRVRFTISVRAPGRSERLVVSAEVDPYDRAADRCWHDVAVDLTPWAGETVELVLRTTGPAGAVPDANLAGWAAPRLVGAGEGE